MLLLKFKSGLLYTSFTRSLFPGKNQYLSPFKVILIGVRGIELAIPGSAVKCFTTEPNPLAKYSSNATTFVVLDWYCYIYSNEALIISTVNGRDTVTHTCKLLKRTTFAKG